MRTIMFVLLLAIAASSCSEQNAKSGEDKAAVEKTITQFHRVLEAAYQGKNVDLSAAIEKTFDHEARYVTYWGVEEPIDTTRQRMLYGVGNVENYMNSVENIESRVYGAGAVVSCIVRQEYTLQGHQIDEFLPTTYVLEKKDDGWRVVFTHRSADFQTINQQLELTRQKNEPEAAQ
ncbi:MAG TPA: hypothetical protein DCX46_00285 [Bacteroidetes bacterium]|nr:hypothetical protein [Bacteroidota bacterium]